MFFMGTYRVNTKGIASGKSGNDLVYGDSKENILIGNGGNDSLWGRGGTDLIDGGSGNDKLYGETGDDLLNGGLGRDTLTGGAGRDVFTFETKPSKSSIDTITDFSVTYDTIGLHTAIFKGIAKAGAKSTDYIKSSAFWAGSKAHDADDRIIYNKSTGALYYDPDGSGSQSAVQFATLDKSLKMTYKDFIIY
jgi:Ca2+-binding RTX toxin-like protein